MRNVIEILLNTHTQIHTYTQSTPDSEEHISSSIMGDKELDEQLLLLLLLREEQDALFYSFF